MTRPEPATTVYVDDPDPAVYRIVTNHVQSPLTFTPMVGVDGGPYDIAATWQGDPGTQRTLRIPVAGLTLGLHNLYLQVPGDSDFKLDPEVLVTTRT